MSFQMNTNSRILPNSISSIDNYVPSKCWISDWLEILLKKIAKNNVGPTFTTRWLFLACNCIYNSYQFVQPNKTPVDSEYWKSDKKASILINNGENLQIWMEEACQYFFPILITQYMGYSISEHDDHISHPYSKSDKYEPSMSQLKSLLNSYLSSREEDGWKNTMVFKGTLPNGDNVIYADVDEKAVDQNLNDLPSPNGWTPLKINGIVKKYLTPEWGTANKGVVDDSSFQELLSKANKLFPSDSVYEKEMKEVFDITASLNNEQKMTAEYWAGGPGTVTPPGMWMVFMDVVIRSNAMDIVTEIKNYTVLASSLYQSSICAWRLKREHLQARPIQKIRQYKYGKEIDESWNPKNLGQYWIPYQELNFVTPPFPDFVSGHSTFGSSSSKIFCHLLQTDSIILNKPTINLDIIKYLSPILKQTEDFSINNVFILPNTSQIEKNDISILSWNTWTEMASSSGKSRIYGGIHIENSNKAGQYLGSLIADKIWNIFKDI